MQKIFSHPSLGFFSAANSRQLEIIDDDNKDDNDNGKDDDDNSNEDEGAALWVESVHIDACGLISTLPLSHS